MAACVEGLAAAASGLGDPYTAAVLLGGASAIRPAKLPPARYVDGERSYTAVKAALAPAEFDRAYAEGRALSPDEVLTLAREQAALFAAL